MAPYRCDVRPVLWRVHDGPPAFSLRPGATIEISQGDPVFAASIATLLKAAGYRASTVQAPTGTADCFMLTESHARGSAEGRHWAALQAAKAARRAGAIMLFLQSTSRLSGLDGLSRTLRKEWPESSAFAWTLQASEPSYVARCLNTGHPDGEITHAGQMLVPEPDRAILPSSSVHVTEPAVWLVTGGARGVTAACAIELARAAGGTILLAGRSAETPWPDNLPLTHDLKALRSALVESARSAGQRAMPAEIDRTARALLAGAEIRQTLAEIRSTGAAAVYLALDASDRESVAAVLESAQARWGRITGLVHGAGVLADRLAMDKTEAELKRVFAPKVAGLENMLGALDPAHLRHIALFSSAAAFFGNKGQSDYAMANAVLASAGRSLARSHPKAQVKVFHWGPWAGGMVDDALAAHFESQGIPLIPVKEGARIFANELLGGPADQVELVVGEAWASA